MFVNKVFEYGKVCFGVVISVIIEIVINIMIVGDKEKILELCVWLVLYVFE